MIEKRYHFLDSFRGAAILSMILYHAMWDMVYIVGLSFPWFEQFPGRIWQQSICWSFIFLSGFCAIFSKNSLRAGLVVSGAGLLVTVVTLIVIPENRVVFGVLTMLGACMMISSVIKKTALMKFPVPAAVLCSVLFFLTKEINKGYFGFADLHLLEIPKAFYLNLFTTFLGFPYPGFYSTDYFSIFPWCFLFFAGFFLSAFFKSKDSYPVFLKIKIPPLSFIGRHSLLIYLLHQPILYLLCMLILER